MGVYFAGDYPGPPFEFLGVAHLAAIGFLIAFNLWLISFKKAGERVKRCIRWGMAIVLWGNEIAWHVWNASVGRWTIQTMLPLHLCSLLVWLSGWMLVTKSYRIYEFSYFLGIGGAIQAVLTPDLGIYGFPHFRFFQTFISHGLIITTAIYMTVVEGFRPTWKSLGRVLVGIHIYMVPVFFLNRAIGSNYLMINGKPATPSLLDFFPDWPVYILYMEGIGLLTSLLLYLPFLLQDYRSRRRISTQISP
ncbi:MAG: TIGR02206 family membrane protein [Anaerolineales bacterium]|nr:TIGR02206 family membrane protein [Anaerolineales bacterium]MCX7608800.1 TIGR02206 family membrane protein [Anaerolineales bacterium]MDW8227751.1 TIGR02206 family membrane protein [Anaerolineales bacterium]